MNIMERIEKWYPTMTKKQKQIADYIKANMDTMTFVTLKEMSRELGITEVTILNTCQILEYSSFNEVKYEARKYLNEHVRSEFYKGNAYYNTDVPKEELNDKESLLEEIGREEASQLEQFFREFDCKEYLRIAKMFYQYEKVVLCGRGASYLVCERLASGLSLVQKFSTLVNTELNESVYAMLPSLDKNTLLVAVAFPDYYFLTEKLAEYAKKIGVKVLVITDSENAAIVKYADEVLYARCRTRMSINTLSVPMALINMLDSAIKIEGNVTERQNAGEIFGSLFED